ncbi:MAG: LPS assembly lipoprotein LptE [Cryomorphaceae bacterium]|nr:LPS assembly lipoprotein LptE [Flavobacteriales bacterium]
MKIKTQLFLLVLLLGFESCSVGYSFSGADIPAEANSFSVETFQNITPQAGPNYDLAITEALKDLMLAQTRLDLIEKRGDLQFEGVVTKYEIGNAAVSSEELTTLNRLTITLKVKYTNAFDREKNFEKTFSRFADYNSSQDFTAVEAELIREINDQLIQDIFDASLGAW